MSLPCIIPVDRAKNVLKGVYHPARLKVRKKCLTVIGTVKRVHREIDLDYHITVDVDPAFKKYLYKDQPYLICEIIPFDQKKVKPPRIGIRASFTGPWVFDKIHKWNEIHPVWKVDKP